VLAVASGGGHWIQLQRIMPAFDQHERVFVTTLEGYRQDVAPARFYRVRDANIRSKLALLVVAAQIAWILLRERPDIVVSTGAAPGYFAIRLGRLLGARTIWLDSIANAEELSLSGQKIGRHADLWLTQWPHLARPEGPYYAGAVL